MCVSVCLSVLVCVCVSCDVSVCVFFVLCARVFMFVFYDCFFVCGRVLF